MTIKQTKPDVFKSPGRSRDERLSSTSGVFASGERGNKMTEDKDKALQVLVKQELTKLLADPRRAIRLYEEAQQESEEEKRTLKRKIELKRQLITLTEVEIKTLEGKLKELKQASE